jgi:hypothetical protein
MDSPNDSRVVFAFVIGAIIAGALLFVLLDGGKTVQEAAERKAFDMAVEHAKKKVLGFFGN